MMAEKIVQMPTPPTVTVEPWRAYIQQMEAQGHKNPVAVRRYDYRDLMTGTYVYSRVMITAEGEAPYFRTGSFYSDGAGEHFGPCRTDVPAVYGDMDAYTRAMAEGKAVYYVTGEQNVDALAKLGMPAITKGEATDWTPKIADIYHGATVIIVTDNTVAGRLCSARIRADLMRVAGNVKVVFPGEDGTVSAFLAAHTADEIKHRLGGELPGTLDGIYGADTFVDVTEDFYNEIPPKDWMIEGIITRGECAMISSAAKAGKSYLMTQLAITAASGGEWLGRFKCKKVSVLYLCGENEINDARRRFKQLFTEMGINPAGTCKKIGMYCVDGMVHSVQEIQSALINEINRVGYELIILDPLYCFYEGSELDEEVAKLFVMAIKEICRKTKTSVICVHHHSKGASTKYSNAGERSSGSGVFPRAFSTNLSLTAIPKAERLAELPEGVRAFVFEGAPRQAGQFEINVLFRFPIWEIDKDSLLPDDAMQKARTLEARSRNGNNRKADIIKTQLTARIDEAFSASKKTDEVGDYVTTADIAKAFAAGGVDVSTKAIEGHIDRSSSYSRDEQNGRRNRVRKTEFQGLVELLQDRIDSGKVEVVHTQMELPLTT